MRIISGKLKSRLFYPPDSLPIRPTTDFAKTAFFNIMENYYNFENITVLDLFSGSGAISYEFASRGCQNITAVDRDSGCIQFINQTAKKLNVSPYLTVIQSDAIEFIKNCNERYDIVFAGPPYAMENIADLPDLVLDPPLINPKGFFFLEHSPRLSFDLHDQLFEVRNYGKTYFSIFRLTD